MAGWIGTARRGARAFAAAALAVTAWAGGVRAESPKSFDGPLIKGEIDVGFRVFGPVASDFTPNQAAAMNFDVSHIHFGAFATSWLSLQGVIKGEPVRELRPHRTEAFRGFGVFTAELYLNADFDDVAFFVGKFMPTFGQLFDHHKAWGLFATDFTEDYETLDYVGAGFVLRGDFRAAGAGRHELTAQAFFADTTILHRSIITAPRAGGSTVERQSRLRKSDGGVGNTGKLDNFSVTLDSGDFDFLPGVALHFGYRFLHRSPAGVAAGDETRNEHGLSVAVDYNFTVVDFLLPGTTRIQTAAEWVRFRNAEGNRGSRTYWAANAILANGPWTWHLTGTLRDIEAPDTVSSRDRLFATSVFYRLDQRWQVGAGYKYQRVRDDDTGKNTNDHVLGLKLLWNYDFSVALK